MAHPAARGYGALSQDSLGPSSEAGHSRPPQDGRTDWYAEPVGPPRNPAETASHEEL